MSKWEMVRLGDVCDVRDGTHDSPKFVTMGYPLVTSKNVSNGYIDVSEVNYISKEDYEKIIVRSGVDNGDIIMPMIGTIGNPVIVQKTFDFAIKNVALIKFVGNCVLNKYVFYVLSSNIFKRYITKENRGGTQKFISLSNLRNFQISLPPLDVQKKIAKTLDVASELITLRKKQLAELDHLIKATFYDMFGDPVTNEKGWDEATLDEICEINPTKKELVNTPHNLEVTFLGMADISNDGKIILNSTKLMFEVERGFTYFVENDVLFAKITPCMENGKGIIARGLSNKIGFGSTEFHVLRPKRKVCNSEWLYQLTVIPIFRKMAEQKMTGSAGQRRVPVVFLKMYKAGIPPLDLQNKFAAIVTKIEEQKALVQKAIDESQYLFDSLMSEYFD